MEQPARVIKVLWLCLYLHGVMADCQEEYLQIVEHGHICARAFLHSNREESQSCMGLVIDIVEPEHPSLPSDFKEAISSMVVSPGCKVTVWDMENYAGNSRTFYAGKHFSLMDVARWVGWWAGNWNDKIASLKCTCTILEVDIKSG